jgi:hypothetical protein
MHFTPAQKWRYGASLLSAIPVIFFVFFGITNGAPILQVVLRVVPVVALAALGWFRPQVAGWALVVLGIVFAGLYASTVRDLQLVPTLVVAILFCIPLIVSGALFLRAHQKSLNSISNS